VEESADKLIHILNEEKIKQTENFNRKTKLLTQNAKSYNPVCEIPELQIISNEKTLPGNYFQILYFKLLLFYKFKTKQRSNVV
jgi:hypothetical protein